MIRSIALLALLSTPFAALADETNFVFSPVGPGAGNGSLALGARMFMVGDNNIPIPMPELNYVRGFTDRLQLEAAVATLGVITLADVGMRFRVFGDADSVVSLALEGGVSGIGLLTSSGGSSGGAFIGGLTPGVSLGIGARALQLTFNLDAPIAMVGGSDSSSSDAVFSTGSALLLRPSAAVEIAVSDGVNLFLRGSFYIVPEAEAVGVPTLSIGASF